MNNEQESAERPKSVASNPFVTTTPVYQQIIQAWGNVDALQNLLEAWQLPIHAEFASASPGYRAAGAHGVAVNAAETQGAIVLYWGEKGAINSSARANEIHDNLSRLMKLVSPALEGQEGVFWRSRSGHECLFFTKQAIETLVRSYASLLTRLALRRDIETTYEHAELPAVPPPPPPELMFEPPQQARPSLSNVAFVLRECLRQDKDAQRDGRTLTWRHTHLIDRLEQLLKDVGE